MTLSMVLALAPVATLAAVDPSCPSLSAGDEIKVIGRPAIYLVDNEGKIRAITNGDVYKTYKSTYGGYKSIGGACLNSLPQPTQFPSIMTYRAGAVVVRYSADPTGQLYVVEPGNALAKISLANARTLYGANLRIRDISLIDWPHYINRRADVSSAQVTPGMTVRTPSTGSKVWYVDTKWVLHEVSPSAMAANFFLPEYVFTVPDSAVAGLTVGDMITSAWPQTADRTGSGYAADGTWVGTASTPTTPGTVSGLQLNVAVASKNPTNSTNIAVGVSSLARVLDLNFSAGNSNVVVTGLNLTRSGLSVDQDVNNVYLMDGNTIVASNLGISNGVVNFSDPSANGLFTVPANGTKKITVAVTMNSSAAGRTVSFGLAGSSAITSNAGSISGSFPITSDAYTGTLLTNSGGVQITNSSAGITAPGISVNAGQKNFTVGQFSLLGQNQTVQVLSIKVTLIGSANTTDVNNYTLWNGGTQVGQAVPSATGNAVVFDLSNAPLQLTAGQTANLIVRADILGGVNRYFQMSIQRNYDVVARDTTFNMGLLPTLNTGNFPMNLSYVTINQGSLTVVRSTSSPSGNLLPGGTNQTVATFDMTANGEAVRLTAVNLNLALTNNMTSTNLTNLKLVDDQGQQIGTTQATVGTSDPRATYSNLNYIIPANTTRKVSVVVDVASGATGNLQASINGLTAQGFTSLSNITPASQSGNLLTANATLLTVAGNGTQNNVVAGQVGAKIGSFTITAGSASDVTLSNITLKVPTTGSPASSFQNLRLLVGSTQVGTTQSTLTNGTSYNFSLTSPITITKGGQLVIDVYADVLTGATFSSNPAVAVPAGGISAIAVATNQSITGVPASDVNAPNAAVLTNGTLSIVSAGSQPSSQQVAMGTTGIKLATYQLNGSSNEDIQIRDVYLRVTSTNGVTGGPQAFVNYRLVVNGVTYGQATNLDANNTTVPFNLVWAGVNNAGNNLVIAKNQTVAVDVYADANTWDQVQSTGLHTDTLNVTSSVRIATVTYQGVASSVIGNATTSIAGNVFSLFRSVFSSVVSAASVPNGYSSQVLTPNTVVSGYTFTASNQGDAIVNTLQINWFINGVSSTTSTLAYTIYATNPGSPGTLGDVVATGTTPVSGSGTSYSGSFLKQIALPGATVTDGVKITAGSAGSRTFVVAFNVQGSFSAAANISSHSIGTQLTNWTWNDQTRGVSTPVNADPNMLTAPITGHSVAD